jgi:hypothetical protein
MVQCWYAQHHRQGGPGRHSGVDQGAGRASPGSELEITLDDLGVRLERVAAAPRLVRVGRRLVARPTAPVEDRAVVDIAALVEEERNRWP